MALTRKLFYIALQDIAIVVVIIIQNKKIFLLVQICTCSSEGKDEKNVCIYSPGLESRSAWLLSDPNPYFFTADTPHPHTPTPTEDVFWQ